MTKDVLLSLRGLQFNNGEDGDNLETITTAQYYKQNASHYVLYDEVMEGFEQSTRNIVKFRDNSLELTKRGLVNVHMIFEENRKNMTNYSTPFGDILIGIDSHRVKLTEEEKRITLNVDYALEVNYEFVADCHIEMEVLPRGAEGFTLR